MTRKTAFFEGWSWFKFNNLRLTLSMNLKFYTSVAKGLKLKVRKFWGLIPTFIEVTGEKLVGGPFCPPILNKDKIFAEFTGNIWCWSLFLRDYSASVSLWVLRDFQEHLICRASANVVKLHRKTCAIECNFPKISGTVMMGYFWT